MQISLGMWLKIQSGELSKHLGKILDCEIHCYDSVYYV